LIFCLIPVAAAADSHQLGYSGRLLDSTGAPVTDGDYDMAFRLYNVAAGGSSLHTETRSAIDAVAVLDGHFYVVLGSGSTLPDLAAAQDALYLEIEVEGETLSPRHRITAAPWALAAPTAGDAIPSGAVMFFNLTSCPPGWSSFNAAQGRTIVGTPNGGSLRGGTDTRLSDQGRNVITDVPTHVHAVDPPSTVTTTTGSHYHAVNPPNTTTSNSGAHSHEVTVATGGTGPVSPTVAAGSSFNQTGKISQAPAHSHTVDIGEFNTRSAGDHHHNVDILQFNSSAAGVAGGVDVTMPYVQLLACEKD
jgi:hypothetical protein